MVHLVRGSNTVDVNSGGLVLTSTTSNFTSLDYLYLDNTASISDERLKTNIQPLIDPLSKISQLKGVYFKWIKGIDIFNSTIPNNETMKSNERSSDTSELNDNRVNIGLIAQDVLSVLPEAVESSVDSPYLAVQYLDLIPLMIEAVQELDLKSRNNNNNDDDIKADFVFDIMNDEMKNNSIMQTKNFLSTNHIMNNVSVAYNDVYNVQKVDLNQVNYCEEKYGWKIIALEKILKELQLQEKILIEMLKLTTKI